MAQNYYISGLLLQFYIPAFSDNHGIISLGQTRTYIVVLHEK